MRKKSKNFSGKKKNGPKSKKKKTSVADNVLQSSLSVLPMEINSPELSSESPSTSDNSSQKTISLLESDELIKINQKVNILLDKCFKDKSEMLVDRRVLEDLVSDTLGHFFSQEDKFKSIAEAKQLTEKCKTLQTEQIKLNRQRYALKKQVEDAKHIIKKMIDEKQLYNRGIVRRIMPGNMKRQVRSVGLQVCLVGPVFVSKPIINYSTSITSRYLEVPALPCPEVPALPCPEVPALPCPEVRRTARKRTTNIEIGAKKDNQLSCTSNVNQSQSASNAEPLKKENPSVIKSHIITRKMSEESVNSRTLPNKEISTGSKSNITTRRMSEESASGKTLPNKEISTGSKSNITTRRMTEDSASGRTLPNKEISTGSKSNMTTRRMSGDSASGRTLPNKEISTGSKSNITTRRMSGESASGRTLPNKEISTGSKSNITTRRMTEDSASRRTLPNKEISTGSKSNITTRRMSEDSARGRTLPNKEISTGSKSNITTRRMSEDSSSSKALLKRESISGNKSNITSKRMSTRKTKADDTSDALSQSLVKVKSIEELTTDIKKVKKVGKSNEICNDGILRPFKQDSKEIIIKEEVIEEEVYEVVEISEDEDIQENITEMKEVTVKKEAGIQVGENDDINKQTDAYSSLASSVQGPGPLIKVRSPEFINEQFIKSLNSSSTTKGENISFCQLPKYPLSPKYPPNVSKPPAPILQVGKKSNIKTQGIMLTWSFACKKPKNIVEYQLYAYQERSGRNNSNEAWKKVGDIKALPLPMACYLSQFVEDETYHFIIRAVDSHKRLGDFSIPAGIKLQKLDPTIKTPTGTIFKVPPPINKF